MSLPLEEEQFLSRGIDYLGSLGMKLRDLQGFATLAFELIQNADDSSGASWIRFDLRRAALVVDNDGVFSDCGAMEAGECPWRSDPEIRHRCDFHRFRRVAGADKRNESGTVGAFGIGFTSVYQVTDHPEVLSGSRHWILDETRSETERIRVCSGCPACHDESRPGTRFILPWAVDPESPMRKALGAQPVALDSLGAVADELTNCLPTALIFLNRLRSIELLREGEQPRRIVREVEGDLLVLDDGSGETTTWHLLRGEFGGAAERLKQKYPGRIEAKRLARVQIAIPEVDIERGLFCAFLPTQHDTGLPFHVHADFFPTSDRKRIVFDQDFQSEWNRAAVEGAAQALRSAILRLRELIGHTALWRVLASAHTVAQEAESKRREPVLAAFWRSIQPEISRQEVVLSSTGVWRCPSDVYLSDGDATDATALFEAVGLAIVHRDLRSHSNLLRSREVGVSRLGPSHVASALKNAGLSGRVPRESWPAPLAVEQGLPLLWREIAALLRTRPTSQERTQAEALFAECAIAPGLDGALWPCSELFRSDPQTIDLFRAVDPSISFLADPGETGAVVKELCRPLTVARALDRLESVLGGTRSRPVDAASLLRWFDAQRGELAAQPNLRARLATLAIFPSAAGLRPLRELSLPGNFADPLGLADLLDVTEAGGCRELLELLGAPALTFERYAMKYVPRAFADPATSREKKEQALLLLASRLDEIRAVPQLQRALIQVPLVACSDGEYRAADQAYLPGRLVHQVLGEKVPTARWPRTHEGVVLEFYRWLGVAAEPRYVDVVARVREVTASAPTPEARDVIKGIFGFLGERVKTKDQVPSVLNDLQRLAWLPSQDAPDHWHTPAAVHAVFRRYLYESQARFLDIPHAVQNASTAFLQFLGVQDKPSMVQVVDHLLAWSTCGTPVNREVYRFLNDAPEHAAVLRLKGTACLLLPDNSYVRGSDVFWGEHSFGRYRQRLGPELRVYGRLLTVLGVRDVPNHHDALSVMRDIAALHGGRGGIDEETAAVLLHCWHVLDSALEAEDATGEELRRQLGGLLCIAHTSANLLRPREVFFEDRTGLAARFGSQVEALSITRPQGAWRAMAAAGVRGLASALRTHLIECDAPADDAQLAARIRTRRQQLARVIESSGAAEPLLLLSGLDALRCAAVVKLTIQHVVDTHLGQVRSSPESVSAHHQRESGTLYFVRSHRRTPWATIAREIALALRPENEPGQLASALKEVLAAESATEADSVLDELGFPPLQLMIEIVVAGGVAVDSLGGEEAPHGTPYSPPSSAAVASEGEARPTSSPRAQPTPTPRVAGNSREYGTGGGGQAGRSQGQPGQSNGGGATNRTDRPTPGAQPQTQLRSYVAPPPTSSEEESTNTNGTEAAAHRSAVDRAGVDRVIAYELRQGRAPEEMASNHPGFDVVSRDASGAVARLIEVKSLSGAWHLRGAGLSSTQFRAAYDGGSDFWLYVVERATEDVAVIHRIQNPARRVDQFFYDDGWRVVAEMGERDADAGLEATASRSH